jgi:hypothetical protein
MLHHTLISHHNLDCMWQDYFLYHEPQVDISYCTRTLTASAVYWKCNILWNSQSDCKEQLVFREIPSRVFQWMNHEGGVLIQLHYSLQLPEFTTKISEKLVRSKAINICKVERYEMPYASLYAWFLIPLLRKWLCKAVRITWWTYGEFTWYP